LIGFHSPPHSHATEVKGIRCLTQAAFVLPLLPKLSTGRRGSECSTTPLSISQ
jgi:hypothetical protein